MTEQRHVLIVSPHFPPINAPDHQRARMSLPHLEEFGWRATVLAVSPQHVASSPDPLLAETVPKQTPVVRTGALPVRRARVGSLGWRALPYLKRVGDRLLAAEHFDLVFFSTTVFPVMTLGPRWLKQRRVPYLLDLQDLWLSDYFDEHRGTPPGGRIKYGLSRQLARRLEPYTLKQTSHIITVSRSYLETLLRRYRWLSARQFTVMPFGVAEDDFELLKSREVRQSIFDPKDGKRHWVYVGAGGMAMTLAIRPFFRALQRIRTNGGREFDNLVVHFIGTDYAAGERARETFRPVAAECGVADVVQEVPHRLPYFESLKCLLDAEALIVPGSDDPGYTASKIYPYIMADKPMLSIFHEDSSVVSVLRETNVGMLITFKSESEIARMADEIEAKWFNSARDRSSELNRRKLEPYLAREMTRRLCEVFDRCLDRTSK